jgi:hypothetical protein
VQLAKASKIVINMNGIIPPDECKLSVNLFLPLIAETFFLPIGVGSCKDMGLNIRICYWMPLTNYLIRQLDAKKLKSLPSTSFSSVIQRDFSVFGANRGSLQLFFGLFEDSPEAVKVEAYDKGPGNY